MAFKNTPVIELMGRLGHKKIDKTLQNYVNKNHLAKEQLKRHINSIEALLEAEKQRIDRGKQCFEGLTDFEKGLLGELTDVEKAKYAEEEKHNTTGIYDSSEALDRLLDLHDERYKK